jgi:hypothetical protein
MGEDDPLIGRNVLQHGRVASSGSPMGPSGDRLAAGVMTGRVRSRKARIALVPVTLAMVLGACGGVPPPSPASSFRPDVVGVASGVDRLPCGVTRVTLASGDHVDLVMTGSSLNDATPCPSSDVEPSRWLFGTNQAQLAKDHLFLAGRDVLGRPWYGWASRTAENAQGGGVCDKGTYGIPGGAFEEGGSFHLPNGLLLDTSPAFDRGSSSSPTASHTPLVVLSDSWICVDAQGFVVSWGGPEYL